MSVTVVRDEWKGSAEMKDGHWEIVIIHNGALAVREAVCSTTTEKEIEDAIRRYIIEHTYCWQEEHKHTLDDCGSVGCKLTQATWNEWNHEDFCQDCPFVIWDEDEWKELFEEDRARLSKDEIRSLRYREFIITLFAGIAFGFWVSMMVLLAVASSLGGG